MNFGIIYGISSYGLSENLEIPRDEAQAYIDAYLARFPYVQDFIARTIEQAACLAAYHSQGRGGGKIPVDCTMVRFVRKPSGAMPGKVIYTDYQTILARSDDASADRGSGRLGRTSGRRWR